MSAKHWILPLVAAATLLVAGCMPPPPCGAPGGGDGCFSTMRASDSVTDGASRGKLCQEVREKARNRCLEYDMPLRSDKDMGCKCEERMVTGTDDRNRETRPEFHILCQMNYRCGK